MFNLERSRKDLWNPSIFDRDLDRFFDVLGSGDELHTPACEVLDEGKFYTISMDVPGIKEKDISLEVKDSTLYISGERKFEKESEKNNVLRTERRYGKFSRAFTLPQDVDSDSIEADFFNGVLEITVPKSEKAQARKISIGKGAGKAIETNMRS